MAIQNLMQLPTVSGVAANSLFTVQVPVGANSYELFGLELGGTTFAKTAITNLELLVQGVPVQQFQTVAHLEAINAYYGFDVNSDEVVLQQYFEHLTEPDQRKLFNIGTADVPTLQLRGSIGTATAPTLTAFTSVESITDDKGVIDPNANRLGLFRKVRNFTFSVTGNGVTEFDNIPREAFMLAMHLLQTSGNVTNVEVWVDNVRIWDASDSRMENIVNRSGRVRQTNAYHIDFHRQNVLGNQLTLSGTSDFRLKVSHSADDTIALYAEYLSDFATA